jgi:choline dehydrogenase-like flavoprotein
LDKVFFCGVWVNYGHNANFNFIGGPAGALLASKLAASKEAPQVLLLEAGGDSLTDYPARERFTVVKTKPELNWGYTTVPQQQLSGQQIDYARGKALGGTTNTNFGMWTRPSQGDFEEWEERIGDNFFGWEHASRSLDAIERYGHLDNVAWDQYGGRRDQGTGDVPLSFSNDRNEANEVLLNAFANYGSLSHPFTRDINSGELIGTAVIPIMAKDGIYRATAATVYLSNPPANLHIKKNSEVARVILDEGKTRCIGVETVLGQTCQYPALAST